MGKRKKNYKRKLIVKKGRTYYPMAYCTHEDLPIAVSKYKCTKRSKVKWFHWKENVADFLHGYEFSLEGAKDGDVVHCPVCGKPLDFRFWMSDTEPSIIQFDKDSDGTVVQYTERKAPKQGESADVVHKEKK